MSSAYNEPTLVHEYRVTGIRSDTVSNTDNVILVIRYQVMTTDTDGTFAFVDRELKYDRGSAITSNFIPFDELDEVTVIEWIKSSLTPIDKSQQDMMLKGALDVAREEKYDKTIPWLKK